MLMILFSILSVIRHLICGNNLNLIYETVWTGGKRWIVDFIARKTQLVSSDQSIGNGSIDMKMDGSLLQEK